MKNIFTRIDNFCAKYNLLAPGSTIIVGLSGGPDSVFLLHYLAQRQKELNLRLIACHIDHGWRPESEDDARWCASLCADWGITFIGTKLSDYADKIRMHGSREDFARRVRRFIFAEIAQEYDSQTIALAHHADDQQETFFIRLIRGASITGLVGIAPRDGLFIHPLLPIYKKEILAYLDAHNIGYRIDASNDADTYLRNRIRHTVIPALRTVDSRFDTNFEQTRTRLQQVEVYLQEQANVAYNQCVTTNQAIMLDLFKAQHPLMQYRILLRWLIEHQVPFTPSQALLDEIIRFFDQTKSITHMLHTHWLISKAAGCAYLEKRATL